MKKLRLFFLSLFVIGVISASAQTKTVSGTVVSAENGDPIVGASIVVENTSIGTTTNMDGKFSLNVPEKTKTLVVSYIGMEKQEVEAGTNLLIKMESSDKTLDEVIVIAYGKTKKSSFTGSASTVSAKDFDKRPISTVSSALEGNLSGVQVSSSTGQPGDDASIRIRGFSSINQSSAPLYVLDGTVFNGRLSDLNPADIESMTVLKDAASTSLYGASAGNGVILITTKKATDAKSTGVTLNVSQGWSGRAYADYQTVNVWDYYPLQWAMLKNSYITSGKTPEEAATLASSGIFSKLLYNPFTGIADNEIVTTDGLLNPAATSLKWGDDLDWAKDAYRTGHRQEYNIGYTSATKISNTYASIGYLNDKGYMIKTDFERYSGRLNYNINPVSWFKSGLNIGLSRILSDYSTSDASSSSSYNNLTRFIRNMAPIYPIHKHDLTTGAYLDAAGNPTTNPADYVYDYDGTRQSDPGRDALVETLWNSRDYTRGTTNARTYVTITPIKYLDITANYGYDLSDFRGKVYENTKVGDGVAGPGRLRIESTRSTTKTFNQLINYNRNFDKHHIDLLLGHESYDYSYEYLYSMKTAEIIPGVYEYGNFVTINDLDSYTNSYKKEGYLARANYDYEGKYYGTFSYRHDGSSRFAPENRWGDFWSFGASWRLSEEAFIKKHDWIDNLKLRASYGETGNDDLDSYYPYQTLYELGINNGSEAGAYFTTLANYYLKWETQVSKDAAVEFSFFRKLNGSVEYFEKESRDLLFNVQIATSTGVAELLQNIGKSKNYGIELELNYNIFKNKDFSVSVGGNLTWLNNVIVSLPEENRENGILNGSKKFLEEHSIYDYWLTQWYDVNPDNGDGLYYFDTEAYNDADGTMTPSALATIVEGPNGEVLTNSYAYAKYDFSGSAIPKFYGGFNLNATYKGFDFSALFSYSLGAKILDLNYASLMSM